MNELIQNGWIHRDLRWYLLGTASAIVLIASGPVAALADDADRPTLWIDLGGQLERIDGKQPFLSPEFFNNSPPVVLAPMVDAERPSRYGIGEEGKITLNPQGSNWVFSASVRYGRSNAARHKHYQSAHPYIATRGGDPLTGSGRPVEIFGDGQSSSNESHLLVDFMAGKDVGLGIFGSHGSSVFSAGVRFAQFTSGSDVSLHARPMYRTGPHLINQYHNVHGNYFRNYTAVIQSRRSTRAIGPSVSWDASLPVAGSSSGLEATLDWGANAAVLFGRQRARVHHQTTGGYFHEYPFSFYPYIQSGYTKRPADQNRSHSVTIPNVGGFAGVSFRYLNAKISMGYRADFFFGAVDSGIDARQSETLGFYGPFATISIGLGG